MQWVKRGRDTSWLPPRPISRFVPLLSLLCTFLRKRKDFSRRTDLALSLSWGRKGEKTKSRLTLSFGHLEALSERQRGVTGLTTSACGAEGGKMLRLVDDFDETISKRL